MKFRKSYKIACILTAVVFAGAVFTFSTHQPSPDFNADIKPIINSKCITCHGGVKQQAGFSLLFRDEALANTESGKPAIIPGNPDGSELIRRLTISDPEERMPYQHPPLKESEINLFRRWIKDGAKWGDHWAYVPVQNPALPEEDTRFFGFITITDRWSANDLDTYVLQKMKENELSPSPKAANAVLARRAGLDLIGLPPTDKLAADFISDSNQNAYAKFIDSLLASPRFGERWASVWLDLARYSDTKGYERDDSRNIWKYRDWIIEAFNNDKPYNIFLKEQIAGDLLPNATDAELIATAFHRNTMTNDEGGTDNEEFRVAATLDRVNTTWEAVMGTSFACVQCHSHPYDPFKHEDYYRFLAFFNNSRDEDTFDEYPVLRHFDSASLEDLARLSAWLDLNGKPDQKKSLIHFIKTWQPSINSLTADSFANAELIDTKWLGLRNDSKARLKGIDLTGRNELTMRYHNFVNDGIFTIRVGSDSGKIIAQAKLAAVKERSIIGIALNTETIGVHDLYLSYKNAGLRGSEATGLMLDWLHFGEKFPRNGDTQAKDMARLFRKLVSANVPATPVMIENTGDMSRRTNMFDRGNWLVKGKEVTPGTPASLHPFPNKAPSNRAGLAMWLTDKQNPLTARTMVNRLWEQLFGYGLVETLEDLGTQGASPTHPELLDHLAYKFMHDFNWSIKSLLKYIVLSSTYLQDSRVTPELLEKDPLNRYFARSSRIRLSAEQVRDQGLAASGLLSSKMYGKSVMPYQPEGLWQSPYNGLSWEKSKGEDQYRRAIYTFWKRSAPYPSMITFDAATRDVCASRRIRTNTPLQALVTLNDDAYHEMAFHLASKMRAHSKDAAIQIRYGYQKLLFKSISNDKLHVLMDLYRKSLEAYKKDPDKLKVLYDTKIEPDLAALTIVANALLNLDEVLTKN